MLPVGITFFNLCLHRLYADRRKNTRRVIFIKRKNILKMSAQRIDNVPISRIISMKNMIYHTRRQKMKGPKGKFAWTATVGERGQIVIPKQARELFGIKPGDTLLLLGDTKRGIAIPPSGSFTSLLERVFADGEHEENELLAAAETETESAEASYADGANANNEADCSDGNGGAI